jgi:hypothetical protein
MNKSIKALAAVAVGSLIMGANVPAAFAGDHADGSHGKEVHKDACNGKDGCKGASEEHKAKDGCKAKEGCKGKDSCKAKEGCKGHKEEHKDHAGH